MEMELADLLGDRNRRLAVATYAHAAFPADAHLYRHYVLSLYLPAETEQLRTEIEQITQHEQPWPQRYLFNIANVASKSGWTQLARKLLYPLAQNPANLLARDHFNKLSVLNKDDPDPEPNVAAVGTTVLFTVDGQSRPPLTLTPEAVSGEHHPFAAQLVGLRVDDEFLVPDKMSGKARQGKVVGLLSAYTALFQEIVRQSEAQEGDFSMQTIQFNATRFEEMERVFTAKFGADEQARRARIKQLLQECARGETGFSAVAKGLCRGNGLDAYHLLTSSESAGFYVVPLVAYEHTPLSPELDYVLDWSTLPLFYHLHENGLLTLPASLWVAAQVPDFLRELIAEKERQPESRISLIISERSMRPMFYADTYHADELAALRKLLTWVETNCCTRLVTEKLDLLREASRHEASWLTDDDYGFFMGVIDTVFLLEKPSSILISDDLVIHAMARRNNAVVSSEKYLRTFAAEFDTAVLPVLLQNHYVGLAFDPDVLFRLFIEAGGTFTGSAYRYLQSLPLAVQTDGHALLRLHTFLRNLYLVKSLSPEHISTHAVTAYVYALRPLNLAPELHSMVRRWINRLFQLLPFHGRNLMKDFETAWQQLAASRLLLPQ